MNEREAFEKWLESTYIAADATLGHHGKERMWEAWRERANISYPAETITARQLAKRIAAGEKWEVAMPAQAVDVGAIREASESVGEPVDFPWIAGALQWVSQDDRFSKVTRRIAAGQYTALNAALEAGAISGEKAGPVDGWQFRWHTEGDDSLLLIAHPEHGGVGVHKEPTDARTIPEAMLYLLARDLLPASPAPDKEGM